LDILIVDDNDDLGLVLVEFLQQVGHRAVAVSDAEKAMAALESRPFDVLLTDVRLPGKSGIALAEDVVKRWPQLGIVISSGYSDTLVPDYFPPGLKHAISVVPKPCDLATLPQTLADAALRAQNGARQASNQ